MGGEMGDIGQLEKAKKGYVRLKRSLASVRYLVCQNAV